MPRSDHGAVLDRKGLPVEAATLLPNLTETERAKDLLQSTQTLHVDIGDVEGPGKSLPHLPRRRAEERQNLLSLGRCPKD